mmetsp:Transcript_9912/g.18692  ORF Transcript_9912/g.18692 Transcript_9912/m.18692 type:complete len:427 (-) Transcript_9912:66-1346(-)
MHCTPMYTSSSYAYSSYSEYQRVMSEEFNIDTSGTAGFTSWLSLTASAEYQKSTASMVAANEKNQAAGGSKYQQNSIATVENRCLSVNCDHSSGRRCLQAYLSDEAIDLWKKIEQSPSDTETMKQWINRYGGILPKKWTFGVFESLDFSVQYNSHASLTTSETSEAISAGLDASFGLFGTSAQAAMKSAFSKSLKEKGSQATLKAKVLQVNICQAMNSTECTNKMKKNMQDWAAIKVETFQDVAKGLSKEPKFLEQTAQTMYISTAKCYSLETAYGATLPKYLVDGLRSFSNIDGSGKVTYLNCSPEEKTCRLSEVVETLWLEDSESVQRGVWQGFNAIDFARIDNPWLTSGNGRVPKLGTEKEQWAHNSNKTFCSKKTHTCIDSQGMLSGPESAVMVDVKPVKGYIFNINTHSILSTCETMRSTK